MTTEQEIKNWMLQNVSTYLDGDEVDCTTFGEDAAKHFNELEDDQVPEIYFEYAADIANVFEVERSI